jgi:hypothetical protein
MLLSELAHRYKHAIPPESLCSPIVDGLNHVMLRHKWQGGREDGKMIRINFGEPNPCKSVSFVSFAFY